LRKIEKDERSLNFSEEIDYINLFHFVKNDKEINDHFLFEVKQISSINTFLDKM